MYKNVYDAFEHIRKNDDVITALKETVKLYPNCSMSKFVKKYTDLSNIFTQILTQAKIPLGTKDKFKYVMLREYLKGSLNYCPVCGKATLRKFCSPKCNNQSQETKNKKEKSYLEKYGVKNPQQNKDIRTKTENTNIKKYGTKNVFQNVDIQEKQRNTLLERYGVTKDLS